MVEASADSPLEGGLVYEARLSVGVWSIDVLPEQEVLGFHNESNDVFLKTLTALEEHLEGVDEHQAQHSELMRLELKLNFLMDLVGQVLTTQLELPVRRKVRLGARGLSWSSEKAVAVGGLYRVDLYLKPNLPRPLVLFGRIKALEGDVVTATFEGISDAVQDGLDKFIFRHHRRAVASQRRQD